MRVMHKIIENQEGLVAAVLKLIRCQLSHYSSGATEESV